MAKTTHPAYRIVSELYSDPRDLELYEQTFLSAVHLAGTRRAETTGFAVRHYGDLTEGYWATVRLADRQLAADLGMALTKYRNEAEQIDQGEDRFDEAMAAIEAVLNIAEPRAKTAERVS